MIGQHKKESKKRQNRLRHTHKHTSFFLPRLFFLLYTSATLMPRSPPLHSELAFQSPGSAVRSAADSRCWLPSP